METQRIELSDVIENIAAGPFGSKLKVSSFVDYGFPIIDGANLKGVALTDNITKYVTEEKARSLHRSIAKRGDVVVTISGTLGQIVYIPNNSQFEEYLCSQRQFRVTFDKKKVYPPYLVFYFHTREGQHKILAFANQTGVPALSQPLRNFRKIMIDLPSLKLQKKIASYCEILNEKIEENERINKNLIQQTQALYIAWFEQFLPFDGSMPSDWRIGTIGDIATIKTNSFSPQKNPGVMLEHYSIPAYDEQHFPVFEPSDNVKSNKYILTDNSVLASKLNPDTKRIWRPMCLTDHAVCSTEFIVFEANNSAYKDFLFSIIDSQSFSDWMCAHTTGSTNSRQRTTPSTTLEFKVPIASDDVIDEFCASVTPMYDLVSQNLQENQRLASLRDSLLPKLMSGETDVSDVDL